MKRLLIEIDILDFENQTFKRFFQNQSELTTHLDNSDRSEDSNRHLVLLSLIVHHEEIFCSDQSVNGSLASLLDMGQRTTTGHLQLGVSSSPKMLVTTTT